jgi:hypothetical protein
MTLPLSGTLTAPSDSYSSSPLTHTPNGAVSSPISIFLSLLRSLLLLPAHPSSDRRVGSAVCSLQSLPIGGSKTFSFSLAWDNPIVRFGAGRGYSRFYTRHSLPSLPHFLSLSGDTAQSLREQWVGESCHGSLCSSPQRSVCSLSFASLITCCALLSAQMARENHRLAERHSRRPISAFLLPFPAVQ